jgi:hypothetical protein
MDYMPRFLNKEVEKEVRADRVLYVAWCMSFARYDNERDPLHNPDYVRGMQRSEAKALKTLKEKVETVLMEREVFDK